MNQVSTFSRPLQGEYYWGVRPIGGGEHAGSVMIIYMPAYYADLGDPETGLNGHQGDSEAIVLVVRYNWATSHWVLKVAYLSAHGGYGFASSVWSDYSSVAAMEYSGRAGGYPRVWVAQFKHANYVSRSACKKGGFLNVDNCDTYSSSTKWRFPVVEHHNIGSNAVKLKNCVYAEYRISPSTECLWATTGRFRGWAGGAYGDGSDPYGLRLKDFQFIP